MARDSALLKTVRGLRREKIYPINEMNGRSVDVGIPFDEANEKRSRLIGNNKENYAFFKFQVSDFDFNDIFSAYFFLVNYQLSCVRNIFVRNDRNLPKKKKEILPLLIQFVSTSTLWKNASTKNVTLR